MNSLKRFIELDIWRGFMIIGMIVFHGLFILDYFGLIVVDLFSGAWHVFGQIVRISFLLLVGISMVISYRSAISRGLTVWQAKNRQMIRSFKVLLAAGVVSVATYFFSPQEYVRFGILHLIAVSIFLLSLIVEFRYLVLLVGVVFFVIGQFFMWPVFVTALDSFPIFPWLSGVAFGVVIGHFTYDWLKKNSLGENLTKIWLLRPLIFLGKHSLAVYLIHVPLLILLFAFLGLIDLDF